MYDDDSMVVQQLRARLMADEPSTTLSPTAVRARGQRRLRRRRLLVSGAAVAAVLTIAAGTALGQATLDADRHPTTPSKRPAGYTPGQVENAMKATVLGREGTGGDASWQLLDVVARASNPGRVMSGDNRVIADQWQATFSAGDEHQLDVRMIYAAPVDQTDLASQRQDCATTLDLGYADVCDVTTSRSGSVVKVEQRATYQQGASWPVRVGDSAPNQGEIPVGRRWYRQEVIEFRPDGLIVTAGETVHTSDRSDAVGQWLESTASLTAIAADPRLRFTNPNPPYDDQQRVGIGRAVIVVPANWPVLTVPCFTPVGSYVFWYSDEYATARCSIASEPHGVAIGIGTLDSDTGRELASLYQETATGDPDTWIDSGPSCSTDDDYCTEWFALESSNAFFSVVVSRPGASRMLDELRDSFEVLPPTETTVPFIGQHATYDQARSALEQAQLRLATPEDAMPGRIGFAFPSMGSAVDVGSDVRLLTPRGQ